MAEKGHGLKIHKWDEFIAALLSSVSVKQAAESVGIHENTLLKTMQNAEFMERYKAARQTVLNAAVTRMQAITGEAVEALREVLTETDILGRREAPANARVSAARCILEMSCRFLESEEILTRLAALEKAVEDSKNYRLKGEQRR